MQRRFGIGLLLVIALLAMSSQAPGQICGMSMPAALKQCDCCATMKSCLIPQQNAGQGAAMAQLSQQTAVMVAPALCEILAPLPATPSFAVRDLAALPTAHSPPRLALFCTFLI